jgi:hypothetical protein
MEAIVENSERNLGNEGGNQTSKYPVEVLFSWLGLKAGDPITPFSVGIAIGMGTIMSCFLVCHALRSRSQWCPWSLDTVVDHLGHHLLKVLRIHAIFDPPTDTMSLLRKTIGSKIAASNRSRPSPLQMEAALRIRVREIQAASTRAKAAAAVFDEVITAYNKLEKVKSCKLSADETACIKLIARSSQEMKVLLSVIWGDDKMQHTSVPMSLLASKFLDDTTDLAVPHANGTWTKILGVTEAKRICFIKRCHGRFLDKAGTANI